MGTGLAFARKLAAAERAQLDSLTAQPEPFRPSPPGDIPTGAARVRPTGQAEGALPTTPPVKQAHFSDGGAGGQRGSVASGARRMSASPAAVRVAARSDVARSPSHEMDAEATKALLAGNEALAVGRHDAAIQLFEDGVRDHPENVLLKARLSHARSVRKEVKRVVSGWLKKKPGTVPRAGHVSRGAGGSGRGAASRPISEKDWQRKMHRHGMMAGEKWICLLILLH